MLVGNVKVTTQRSEHSKRVNAPAYGSNLMRCSFSNLRRFSFDKCLCMTLNTLNTVSCVPALTG